MKKKIFRWGLGALVVILLILWVFTFQVREGRIAVVTCFGNPKRIIREAGLHFQWPWPIERAILLDSRRRVYNTRYRETLTRDKKNVILHTYALWAVDDALRFLQSVGASMESAEVKLDGMISNAKNAVMGKYELTALVSTDPKNLKVDEIERAILDEVAARALEKLGVKVFQVGINRIALPEENVQYVFQQMRAERAQYSEQYLAEGKRESKAIIDQANVEKAKILARATEEAAKIRGDAEAESARLYAEAHRQDPEFFKFYRSLESLKQLLKNNATVILRTDSPPFDVLRKGPAVDQALEGKSHEEKESSNPPGD